MHPTLISISSVKPETLDQVDQLLAAVRDHGIRKTTLFVETEAHWATRDVDRLRRWRDKGVAFGGQGLSQSSIPVKHWKKPRWRRVHSTDTGIQSERTEANCVELIARCAEWFQSQRLARPNVYATPEWTLDRLSVSQLNRLPFRMYESRQGVIDINCRRMYSLPSVSFEADSWFRSFALRSVNASNRAAAVISRRPLRVSLHPYDLTLRLHDDVIRLLGSTTIAIDFLDLPNLAAERAFDPAVVTKENQTQPVSDATGQVRLID